MASILKNMRVQKPDQGAQQNGNPAQSRKKQSPIKAAKLEIEDLSGVFRGSTQKPETFVMYPCNARRDGPVEKELWEADKDQRVPGLE